MATLLGEGVIAQEDFDSEATNPQPPETIQTWDHSELRVLPVIPTVVISRYIYADSNYSAQGWAAGTDFSGTTGVFSYSFNTIQSSSGGARTIALEEITGYFEILISSTSLALIGLARDSSAGGYNNVPSIYMSNGGAYGGLTGGTSLGGFVAGDTLQIAYNASTNRVWFGKNNTYYAVTTTTGALIPGTGNLRCLIMSGSSGGASLPGTFRDVSDFVYSPPSGFTATS